VLRGYFDRALPVQWKPSVGMRRVFKLLNLCLAGQGNLSQLRFLDLEYNIETGRIYEVGMCNALRQRTMDCHTRLSPRELAMTTPPNYSFSSVIGKRHEAACQAHNCMQGSLDAHQVAKELKKQGVTPQTVFVVWALNKSDLRALRQWLEAEGHSGILPQEENCVMATLEFRNNLTRAKLENGKSFPCKLAVIFPVLFETRHQLYGRNHHALVDTMQLYLMTRAFMELCLKPSDRQKDWLDKLRKLPIGNEKQQGSLDNYWQSQETVPESCNSVEGS